MRTVIKKQAWRHSGSDEEQRTAWRRRTEALLRREIGFIPNRSFTNKEAAKAILAGASETDYPAPTMATDKALRQMPPHLLRLCESPLLTAAEERELFRRMNFLKFRGNQLRARLNPKRPNKRVVEEAEMMLSRADDVMHRIVTANTRLVVSIIRKLTDSSNDFDELLSDGMTSLINAVEKFDFDRGFRFSTYATMVVRRHLYRCIRRAHRDSQRFPIAEPTLLMECPQSNGGERLNESQWRSLTSSLDDMLGQLDPREQTIIRERFGFDSHGRKRSLQSIAVDFGICKERVRQLEKRAMAKLKALAPSYGLHGLLDCDEDPNPG